VGPAAKARAHQAELPVLRRGKKEQPSQQERAFGKVNKLPKARGFWPTIGWSTWGLGLGKKRKKVLRRAEERNGGPKKHPPKTFGGVETRRKITGVMERGASADLFIVG